MFTQFYRTKNMPHDYAMRFTCESTLLTLRACSNTSNMSSWNLSNRL